jgi:predicted nucleic acid-binding protein
MRTVFLDTVGLLAVWDVADQWHVVAEPVFQALVNDRVRLVTTPLVPL